MHGPSESLDSILRLRYMPMESWQPAVRKYSIVRLIGDQLLTTLVMLTPGGAGTIPAAVMIPAGEAVVMAATTANIITAAETIPSTGRTRRRPLNGVCGPSQLRSQYRHVHFSPMQLALVSLCQSSQRRSVSRTMHTTLFGCRENME